MAETNGGSDPTPPYPAAEDLPPPRGFLIAAGVLAGFVFLVICSVVLVNQCVG